MTRTTALASRIAYNSVYAVLCLILSALLLVVPGDIIRQTLTTSTRQVINLIVLAVIYVPAILIVLFVYALRLYVTRTVLASIPKPWMPIEKGDLNAEVRHMIVSRLDRSATIALAARPKVPAPPSGSDLPSAPAGSIGEGDNGRDAEVEEGSMSISMSRSNPPVADGISPSHSTPSPPVWGEVEHYGWSSPASPDLPNLQYSTVLAELPNLIEAKAVTQAPTDLDSISHEPLINPDAVMLLQRNANMTLRGYVAHLTELDVLPGSQNLAHFLDIYERVRFSGRPMSNATFRRLMQLFAELLRAMRPLDPSFLYDARDDSSSYLGFDGHIDDHAPRDSSPSTPSRSIRSSRSFDRSNYRGSAHSHAHALGSVATRRQYRTAPTTPRSFGNGSVRSLSPSTYSGGSFAQSARSYAASRASTSHGSVIRLSTAEDTGDLPYVLRLTDTL